MSSYSGSRGSRSPRENELCCVLDGGERCGNAATSATFSKKAIKSVGQRKQKLFLDPAAGHSYICESHKSVIHSLKTKRRRKASEEEHDYQAEVDFLQLQMNTLRRYRRHYKLQLKPGSNKIQLVEAISKHFKTIRANEKKAVPLFISMVKSHKSKLDHPKPLDTN